MKTLIIILCCLIIAACGQKSDVLGVESDGEYYALDNAAKDAVIKNRSDQRLVCKKARKTGSHFKVKRCTTEEQLAAERSAALKTREENAVMNSRKLVGSKGGG